MKIYKIEGFFLCDEMNLQVYIEEVEGDKATGTC